MTTVTIKYGYSVDSHLSYKFLNVYRVTMALGDYILFTLFWKFNAVIYSNSKMSNQSEAILQKSNLS